MANIDKDLITNKQSCYIFDIDGCLADVHEILLTNEQSYEKKFAEYLEKRDAKAKSKDLKGLKGLVEPVKPAEDKLNKIDWDYFKDHLLDAIPIAGILDLFTTVASSRKVILLTGRSERNRVGTVEWLKKVIIEKGGDDLFRRINFQLIMRGDKEMNLSGAKYKRAKIQELSKQYNIQFCIEDCPEIVEELTQMGILVLSPNREYYRIGQE